MTGPAPASLPPGALRAPSGASPRFKVVMLLDRLQEGGAERLVTALAAQLPRERYDVAVCTTRYQDGSASVEQTLRQRLDDAGVPHFSVARRNRFHVTAFKGLYDVLRDEHVHVLHAHMFGSNVWGTLIGRLAGTPVIVAHEHTWSYQGRPVRKLLDGYFIGRQADAFTCGSTEDRQKMIELEHVPPDRATMIPNAYFPRPEHKGDLRAELGLDRSVPLVGTLAQLRAQKALHVLIDAFALLVKRLPHARLVIGGDGPCKDEWIERAKALGVAEHTFFIGPREDVNVVLEALDVAVMTSDFEATSLFALEAMAYRTPLVCTSVGGLRDMLEPEPHAGLLVPPRDPEATADAIGRVLSDDSLRRSLIDAASDRVREYSVDRFVSRYDELYQRLLRERGYALTGVA